MIELDVCLHGHPIGVIAHRSGMGDATEFRLNADYRSDPNRLVLGQIFEDDLDRVWRTTHRVPQWFSNLLPEGYLRELLAAQAGVKPDRELHLLAALGQDLPGAVTVGVVDGTDFTAGPRETPRSAVDDEEALRFSLAGLQLKFSVALDEQGVAIPVRGRGGRWIAKLPDRRFADVPLNEATMLSWARQAGLEVPDHRLVPTASIERLDPAIAAAHAGQSLLVKRFDRLDDGQSVHIEDFAQVRNVVGEHDKYHAASYESVGRVIAAVVGTESTRVYVERLVFMLLSGNADMHLKNWSLIYRDGRHPQLAPAYDLVATRAFEGTNRNLALKLAKTRVFEEIDLAAFRRLAQKMGLEPTDVVEWVEECAARIRACWPTYRAELPTHQARVLDAHLGNMRI